VPGNSVVYQPPQLFACRKSPELKSIRDSRSIVANVMPGTCFGEGN